MLDRYTLGIKLRFWLLCKGSAEVVQAAHQTDKWMVGAGVVRMYQTCAGSPIKIKNTGSSRTTHSQLSDIWPAWAERTSMLQVVH